MLANRCWALFFLSTLNRFWFCILVSNLFCILMKAYTIYELSYININNIIDYM